MNPIEGDGVESVVRTPLNPSIGAKNDDSNQSPREHHLSPIFPLLQLPQELRDIVYEFYLQDHFALEAGDRLWENGLPEAETTFHAAPVPPIRLVSNQLNFEAREVLKRRGFARISWQGTQTTCKVQKLEEHTKANFRKLRIEIYPPISQHFRRMKKLWLQVHSYVVNELTPLSLGKLKSLEIVFRKNNEAKWSIQEGSPRQSYETPIYNALGPDISDIKSILAIFAPLRDIPRVKVHTALSLERNTRLCRFRLKTECVMKSPGLGSHYRKAVKEKWIEVLKQLLCMLAD
ncbi:MAG: hypothetical protein MMC33_004975 [Icmadophila ericetorum]|nr:hypothetical protein [Icmadophila ericetorum]